MAKSRDDSYESIAVRTLERARKAAARASTEQEVAAAEALQQSATVYAILDLAAAIRGSQGELPGDADADTQDA